MTQTTQNQAREAADLYRATGIPVSVTVVYSLADQNEKLTKERDRLQYELDAVPAIKAERDALTSDNASLHRQLSQWHLIAIERAKERDDAWLQNTALDARCAKLEIERDALAAAGKLALEALVAESRTTESNVTLAQILTAITALRQAGVQ